MHLTGSADGEYNRDLNISTGWNQNKKCMGEMATTKAPLPILDRSDPNVDTYKDSQNSEHAAKLE